MKKITCVMVLILSIVVSSSVFASGASETAGKEKVVVRICHENNPGEPIYQAVEKWAELINERTDGSMEAQTFPSSQLGSKNDVIDQMLAGESMITLADGAFYADRGVPDFGIVFGPYLFESWDECWTLIESDWYAQQSKKLEAKGIKLLSSNWKFGDRHTITKDPVNRVEDLKGMKIRVPNNEIQVKGFEVLDAVPTPMSFGDVYTALQQGTIDGLENTLPVLYGAKVAEVAKNIILDGHVKNFTTWICGTEFFNTLTDEQKELLISTANEAGLYNNKIYDESVEQVKKQFIADGITIVEPSEEVMEGFRNKAKAFYTLDTFSSKWSPNLYETVREACK